MSVVDETHALRLARARTSLEGLSVGDALGEMFIGRSMTDLRDTFLMRQPPGGVWAFTDDTLMALSLFDVLRRCRGVDLEALAASFAAHYDPRRGYGMAMRRLLPAITEGGDWSKLAGSLFVGDGSFGNGSAMRVAPLGAYFADDPALLVEHARRSALVTHAHPEAQAGAVAVAAAAAAAHHFRGRGKPTPAALIEWVLPYVPDSDVKGGLISALALPGDAAPRHAARILGNGSRVSCMDTVPFAVWCAARCLDSYEEAIWQAAGVGGDVDTNCAIVGGIVAVYTGAEAIPSGWCAQREPLPAWAFDAQGD